MYSRPVPPVNYIQPRWTAPVSFESLATYRLYINATPLLYALISLLSLTLPAPAAAATSATTLSACPAQQCVATYSPHADYYPIKDPSSPPDWTVLYFPSYKVVINNLTAGPDTYLLYKCGTPAPVNASTTAGFNASTMVALDAGLAGVVTNRTKYFSSPVQTIGIDSGAGTVAITYLELLGARSQLLHTDAYTLSDVTSPCVNALIAAHNITAITWNATTAPTVSLLIEGNAPSGYPNAMSLAATADATVLRRAGWIKLLGVMLDKEEAALGLYNRMQHNYAQLSAAVQPLVAPTRPVIAWVSSYNGWSIVRSPYRESLVADVGAVAYSGVNRTTTYNSTSGAAFKAALVGVNVLIDETYYYTPTNNYTLILATLGFTAADIASGLYPFLSNASVWRWDARLSYNSAGDDWYESAIAEPDALLADFTRLVAPFTTTPITTPFTSTNTHLWFRNVARGEPFYGVPLTCPSTSAPSLPLYSYWPVVDAGAAGLDVFECAGYLSDAGLFGGGAGLAGCGVLGCVGGGLWSAGVDYFPVKEMSYAAEWSVLYFPSYKLVINNLTTGAETYLLYMCGTPIPVNPATTPGFNASTMVAVDPALLSSGLVNTATKYFSVPVQRVAIDGSLGSIAATYLELLGERTAIAYVDATAVASPCVQYLGLLGVIGTLPYGGVEWAADEAGVDLALYGNGASGLSNGVSMAVTSSVDDVAGYAAWLKFLALFFNKEATATLLYNNTIANIAVLTVAATAVNPPAKRPTVAWVSATQDYSTGQPLWLLEQSAYRDALVVAAGGVAWPVVRGGVSFGNVTAFKAALVGVHAIIDETYYYTPTNNYTLILATLGFTAADIASGLYPFLTNSSVWRNDARVGTDNADDWYESAIAEPDAVIADMLRITAPTLTTPITRTTAGYLWLRNPTRTEPAHTLPGPLTCVDPSAPALPLLQSLQVDAADGVFDTYACPAFLLEPAVGAAVGGYGLWNVSGGGGGGVVVVGYGGLVGSSSSTGLGGGGSGGSTGAVNGGCGLRAGVAVWLVAVAAAVGAVLAESAM